MGDYHAFRSIWVSLLHAPMQMWSLVQRQWWEFKAKHMDKVLLFKVRKRAIVMIDLWKVGTLPKLTLSFSLTRLLNLYFADGEVLWDVWDGCSHWCKGPGPAIHEGVYLWIWLFFWWYVEIGLNHCTWVFNMLFVQGEQPHCGFPEKNFSDNAEKLARKVHHGVVTL